MADLFDIAVASKLAGGGGGGGSDKMTLLKEVDLGEVSTTSSTSEQITSFTIDDINDYDILIFIARTPQVVGSKNFGTVSLVQIVGSSNNDTKNGKSTYLTTNYIGVSGEAVKSVVNTSYYGVAATIDSPSGNKVTAKVSKKYSANYSGAIDGTYMMKVYGIKHIDIIAS